MWLQIFQTGSFQRTRDHSLFPVLSLKCQVLPFLSILQLSGENETIFILSTCVCNWWSFMPPNHSFLKRGIFETKMQNTIEILAESQLSWVVELTIKECHLLPHFSRRASQDRPLPPLLWQTSQEGHTCPVLCSSG